MNAKTRWLDTWRARWVGIKRAGEPESRRAGAVGLTACCRCGAVRDVTP